MEIMKRMLVTLMGVVVGVSGAVDGDQFAVLPPTPNAGGHAPSGNPL